MKNAILFSLALVFASCHPGTAQTASMAAGKPQTGKHIIVDKAAVSSAHPLATEVGVRILEKGGNAVDAAIAVQLALAVVYPKAGNIGGGGFMVARFNDGKIITLDYREKAPEKSSRDMFLDKKGNVKGTLSVAGPLAAGVPGTVDGLFAAHKNGKLPFKDLIQPAIDLAEKGFALTKSEAKQLNGYQDTFRHCNRHIPAFVKEGGWREGDLLVQPELANTLKRIRDKGREGFYEGKVAKMIVDEMKARGGIISEKDLAAYQTVERKPLEFDYKNYHFISMGPPSSGGSVLAQLMTMVERFPMQTWGFHSAKSVHLMVEAERRAYADRATHLGDPDFWNVPARLIDPVYARNRIKYYDPLKATPSDSVAAGNLAGHESNETTHLSVVDAEGNAVAVTTTLNSNFGSKVVVQGAGFVLNNEMDDFSIKPGVANQFGLVGNEANAIAPGKRMLSSMTPTIVLKDKKLFLVVGTPGGSTIITSVFQVAINVIEFGMTLEEAVKAPRFHHQWKPDKISIEKGALPENVQDRLRQMGHKIDPRDDIGLVDAILVLPDGKLEAVGDPRGEDEAGGY